MAGADTKLKVILEAQDRTGGVIGKTTDKLGGMKKAATAAIGAIGIYGLGKAFKDTIAKAANFEKSMSNIATLVDTNVESMEEMSNAVLDLSKTVPISAEELSTSLYQVRSAGIEAAGAIDTLEASSKLAVAGLGSTEEATNILTSAINAFQIDASDAEKVANTFFLAVKSGKTTVSELAQGFGQVAPLAQQLGVEFEELMGITAAMTTSGLKASIAYTQQRAVLANLLKPTKEMQELMDKVGMSSVKASIEMDGLQETVRALYNATDGNNQMLAKAFGSVEALNAVMMLMNETGKDAWEIMGDMYQSTETLNEAFEKQTSTASAQYEILKNNLNAELIKLGNEILPVLVSALPVVTRFMEEAKYSINALGESIGTIIYHFINLINVIKSLPGRAGAFMGKMLGFQAGGIVPGPVGAPMPAIVHGGERIIPTHEKGGGSQITININDPVVREEQDLNRIADYVMDAISRRTELANLGAV